ncbi:GTP cyclohydrolase II [Vermiconidia calcicola]|uniref:GTP cyclohydrolase II n=1 Tax=Vermiconidia calcicola TaxID=1690605 RepID=A0ACC3NFT3_9PEZI|nr:GTP cyclohydrolase II [Vermiconidia calcicola]
MLIAGPPADLGFDDVIQISHKSSLDRFLAQHSHASPGLTGFEPPRTKNRERAVSDLKLSHAVDAKVPPPLVSPAFTPPRTPSVEGQRHDRQPGSLPVSVDPEAEAKRPAQSTFLEKLPEVRCEVRARIPTTTGTEMWLHLYHNNADEKEHLAIVFGPHIRSKSLDAQRPGESERDRMIRGAYSGTLYPGRVSSRVQQIRRDAGVPSQRPSASYLAQANEPQARASSPDPSQISETSSTSDTESTYPPELGPPMVRIHSECYTGETVWSARCDCGEQLDEAARLMSVGPPTPVSTPGSEGGDQNPLLERPPSSGGVIIYLRQEGRGIGLLSKLKAYNLQDLGHDTMEANLLLRHPGDARSYGLATAMLLDLGLGGEQGIKLLTNNPEEVRAVEGPNREVRVVERVPMIPLAWQTGGKRGVNSPEVEKYISTKIEKFKHMFSG